MEAWAWIIVGMAAVGVLGVGGYLFRQWRKGQQFEDDQMAKLWDFIVTRDDLLLRTTELFGWIESGRLKVRIAATFPLAEACDAHRLLVSREAAGKILLIP